MSLFLKGGNFGTLSLAQDLFDRAHTFPDFPKARRLDPLRLVAARQMRFRQEHVAFSVQDEPQLVQILKRLAPQFPGVPTLADFVLRSFRAGEGIAKGI